MIEPNPGVDYDSTHESTRFRYFIFDTSGMGERSLDFKLHFALVSINVDGIGQPRFSHIVVDDKFPPYPLRPDVQVTARELTINWTRPRDQISFFNSDPDLDTGLIGGYHILLRGLRQLDDLARPLEVNSILYILEGDSTWSISPFADVPGITVETFNDEDSLGKVDIFLVDNNRYHKAQSHISATIFGLEPLQKYEYQVFAEDTNHNQSTKVAQTVTFNTTDTSPPKSLDDFDTTFVGRNQIDFSWTPSRDTRTGDTEPNQNILGYRILKINRQDSAKAGTGDTLRLLINTGSETDSIQNFSQSMVTFPTDSIPEYSVSFFFLPPGQWFSFVIWSIDSTGHLSAETEIIVRTQNLGDSIKCLPGFTPIAKENSPYCIEPYEHRDSSGNFVSRVTMDEAKDLCRNMGDANNLGDPHLCSESEWLRACQGSESTNPHEYGIQSIDTALGAISSPLSILQTTCNQGADDKEMAFDFSLRNEICSTNEGVYDMAGNLSEWISVDSTSANVHFKGGNYLKPPIIKTTLQAKALCEHPPFVPQLKRPHYRCISDVPTYTLAYKIPLQISGSKYVCSDLTNHPEGIKSIDILDSIKVAGKWIDKDSSRMQITYLDGTTEEKNLVTMGTVDSLAPLSVAVNQKNLVELIYIPADEYNYEVFFLSSGDLDTVAFNAVSILNPNQYIRDTIEIFTYQDIDETEGEPDHLHDSIEIKTITDALDLDSNKLAEMDSLLPLDSALKNTNGTELTVNQDSITTLLMDSTLVVRNDSILMVVNDSILTLLLNTDSTLNTGSNTGPDFQQDSLLLVRNDTVLTVLHDSLLTALKDTSIIFLTDSSDFNPGDSIQMLIYTIDSLLNMKNTVTARIEFSNMTRTSTINEIEKLNQTLTYLLSLTEEDHDHGRFEFSTDQLNFNRQPSENPLLTRDINENWKVIPVKAFYGYVVKNTAPPGETPAVTFKPAKRFYNFEVIGFRCCSSPLP